MRYKKPNRRALRPTRSKGNGVSIPLLAGAACAIAAAVAAGVYFIAHQRQVELGVDLCPMHSGPVAHIAILVDVTDPLSETQSRHIQKRLDKVAETAMPGTRFSIGVVTGDTDHTTLMEPVCKPPPGKLTSSIVGLPKKAEELYVKQFRDPLRSAIRQAVTTSQAESSPIMEGVQSIVVGPGNFINYSEPRKLILVSDLLQHSSAFSFYRGGDWKKFTASPSFSRMSKNLSGVDVLIMHIPRATKGIKNPDVVQDFWVRYLDYQGANRPEYDIVGDL